MKIARLNRLFTKKTLVDDPSRMSPRAFWERFKQKANLLFTRRPPSFINIPSTFTSAPLSLSNNSSLGVPRNIMGGDARLGAFDVAHNFAAHREPWGGTQENVIITNIPNEAQFDDLADIPSLYLKFDLDLPTVEDLGSVYNFYVKEYEEATQDPDFNELSLINAYGTILNLEQRIPDEILPLADQYPLEDLNPDVLRTDPEGNLLAFNFQLDPLTPFKTIKNYYRNAGVKIDEFGAPASSRYRNLIFPAGSISNANAGADMLIDQFPSEHGGGYVPYYIGLTIKKSKSTGPLVSNFERTKVANFLMSSVGATLANSLAYEQMVFYPSRPTLLGDRGTRTWNLIELLDGVNNATSASPSFDAEQSIDFESNSLVMGTVGDKLSTFPYIEQDFVWNLNEEEFLVNLYETIAQHYNDWSDINQGASGYSEVVMYRLAKYKKNKIQTPIQNFFFFNDSGVDDFKFMDTQVKVDEEYYYELYSYSIVLGNDIVFNAIDNGDPLRRGLPGMNVVGDDATGTTTNAQGKLQRQVVINNSQRIKLVEVLAYSTTTVVCSKPPLFPDVTFRSFLWEDKKIQITMQKQMGTLWEVPISFNQEEQLKVMKLRRAQSIMSGPINFRDDDISKVYEVFRTTTPPSSPMGFKNSLWRRVLESTIIENVIADTTYYYMFRTIDAHGNVSNPSPPYEVTLVGGFSPYLLVNEYDYDSGKPDNKSKSKDMRRFLRLRPTAPQLMVKRDFEGVNSSKDVENVDLGVASMGGIWGRKFKVRITSKETGKKIDYNIEYGYEFEPTEE